jgi:hypothetical protein
MGRLVRTRTPYHHVVAVRFPSGKRVTLVACETRRKAEKIAARLAKAFGVVTLVETPRR